MVKKSLDFAELKNLALGYVARYATTKARLARYLSLKIRSRDWQGDDPQEAIATILSTVETLGAINEEAFSEARASSLARRGYGARRANVALKQAGLDKETTAQALKDYDHVAAAVAYVKKRRKGPFQTKSPQSKPEQEKVLAAMIRAGHPPHLARALLALESELELEDFLRSASATS